jgi:hypothetical protein
MATEKLKKTLAVNLDLAQSKDDIMKKLDLIYKVDAKLDCPPATQDIVVNLKNRQYAIDVANYGPANPNNEDEEYWQKKADQFKTSIDQAKTMRCSNCAVFIIKEKMIDCIEKGLASEMEDSKEIVNLADLGYCELFDFKCAGSRTCDAWVVNGPLKD